MSKEMQEESEHTIFLDRKTINEILRKDKIYQKEDVIIKKWDDIDSINKNYIVQMTKEGSKYIGVLNEFFEREGYGAYFFPNNDMYFGNFKNDMRNFNGIYIWSPTKKDSKVLTESFYGFWRNNKKGHNGIYMWLEEGEGNNDFDEANFSAYVGELENSIYKKATVLQKSESDYHLYHGNLDSNGKKSDNDGFFYSASLDKVFHGKFENDNFISGYITSFNEDGKIKDINYCEFDENLEITNIKMDRDLSSQDKKDQGEKCDLFRNVILEIDYFGGVYENYKKIYNFIQKEMQTIDFFNDKDKFPTSIKLAAAYNINNIYNNIELKVFGRKNDD